MLREIFFANSIKMLQDNISVMEPKVVLSDIIVILANNITVT